MRGGAAYRAAADEVMHTIYALPEQARAGVAVSRLPVVAVVGAPNVGKSSLVNRIMRRRGAVVSERPGTTRDRAYNRAEWAGREFTLVDTGGMEPRAKVGLEALVTLQARVAVEEADVVVHLTDARLGPTEADAVIARELRRARGKAVLAVNKLDNPADDTERHRFYSLGEGEPHAISAVHGLGVGDLLDVVVSLLPESEPESEEEPPGLAIVGRPNVGKSTLLNRLLGADRAVVSEKAGTTTDAVAAEIATRCRGRDRTLSPARYGGREQGRQAGQRRTLLLILADLRGHKALRRLAAPGGRHGRHRGGRPQDRPRDRRGRLLVRGRRQQARPGTPTEAQGDRRPHLGPPHRPQAAAPSTSLPSPAQGWTRSCHSRPE